MIARMEWRVVVRVSREESKRAGVGDWMVWRRRGRRGPARASMEMDMV